MNQKDTFYTTPVKTEKKSNMDSTGIPKEISEMTDESGLIQVELEKDVVIDRLSGSVNYM